MPMHDWTRVEAGIFHDFHLCWLAELQKALNQGGLPSDHGAGAEYHPTGERGLPPRGLPSPKGKRRTLTIRHTNGHRIIAFIEIVSLSNKDRMESVYDFSMKVIAALRSGIHVLLVDPFPPAVAETLGMHGDVWRRLTADKDAPPDGRPLTFAAYAASDPLQAFVNHLAVGDELPEMPLFLTTKKYIDVPLEETYMAAYAGMPAFWRKVLEKQPA
jgi:hypothetical protein